MEKSEYLYLLMMTDSIALKLQILKLS